MVQELEKISQEIAQKLMTDLDDYIENAKEKGPQNIQKIEQTVNQLHDDLTCLRDLSKAQIKITPIGSIVLQTRSHFDLDDRPMLDLVVSSQNFSDPFNFRDLAAEALNLRDSVIRTRSIESLLSDEHPTLICAEPSTEYSNF